MIPRAVPSRKWPGSASLEVANVWLRRGTWNASFVLDDSPVSDITPYLATPTDITGRPYRLAANGSISFIGSYVLGMGFTMQPEAAKQLLAEDPRNRDVIFPYLNGDDLNSTPDQSPTRWVINFRDWPLSRSTAPIGYSGPVASDYPACLEEIVEERVKPEREHNNRKVYRRDR